MKHTFYTSLLCGISRKSAFLAKLISVIAGSLPLMFVPFLTGTLFWSIHAGFGMEFGAEAVCLMAKAFARQFLASLMLVSNAVFFCRLSQKQDPSFWLELWHIVCTRRTQAEHRVYDTCSGAS